MSTRTEQRPVCRLAAVNGNVDVLILDVERVLELSGDVEAARRFTGEVARYRARRDASDRGVYEIAARYVRLS